MLERDLYAPVKALLEERGYTVQAEVASCDALGMRGDECCVVELKLRLNLDVIVQAVARQRFADAVYVAIPAPGRAYYTARFRDVCRVLRRLDVGLITVRAGRATRVDFEARAHGVRRNARLRREALAEFAARRTDRNVGGVTGVPLMTAYRERALTVAALLRRGPATAAALRGLAAPDDTYAIVYRNPYGWFTRLGGGRYELSALGLAALDVHAELLSLLLPGEPGAAEPVPALDGALEGTAGTGARLDRGGMVVGRRRAATPTAPAGAGRQTDRPSPSSTP